nr:acetyltransferase [Ancylobacter koreensis]
MLGRDELQLPREATLYGAGGHARELRFELEADGVNVRAFVDDFASGRQIDGLPVLSFEDAAVRLRDSDWFIAVGGIAARMTLAAKVAAAGLPLGRFVSRAARMLPSARVGIGVQVFHGAVLSASAQLGDFSLVNFGCVLSHDVHVGAYATICPGVHVAGHVVIGERVWIGVGASIRNGSPGKPLIIGDDAFVAAGACVVGDVAARATVAGVPARPFSPAAPGERGGSGT